MLISINFIAIKVSQKIEQSLPSLLNNVNI